MPPHGTNGKPSPAPDELSPASYPEETPVPPLGCQRGPFSALRHRNYRLYFYGQMVSLTGSWLQITALTWLAYDLTRENKWPALVATLQMLPTCFLGVWGGSLAQRWPRRHLILTTQALLMVNALSLAGLALSGRIALWHLLGIAAANGVVNAVDLPARLSFVIDLVGRDDLLNAVALNSMTFNLARALGPALGAGLLAALGPGPCFLLNGCSYLAVLAALARMSVPGMPGPARDDAGGSIRAAFGHLAARPALALLLVLVGAMVFCGWPTLALLPALAQRRLGKVEMGYGLLLSGFGCGALLAALTVASFGSLARGRRFIGAGVAVTISALLGLSLVRGFPLGVGCCMLAGYGLILFMATSQAVVQLSAGDHNRGPIMGIWSMVLSGAQPLGNLVFGPAADYLGEAHVLRLQALGCALAALGVLALLRVRRLRPG